MSVYQPGKNRPWYRRKPRVGLIGSPGWKSHWGAILSQGNWFAVQPISGEEIPPSQLEALDGLVMERDAPGSDGPGLDLVSRLRDRLGLPGGWPVFAAGKSPGPTFGLQPEGFGGIDLRTGHLDPGSIYDAANRYARCRRASFSQASGAMTFYGSALVCLLLWTLGRLFFAPSPLEEAIEQLKSLDHPKLETRLNQSQARLTRVVELCKIVRDNQQFDQMDDEVRDWVLNRQTETEQYLAWVVPLVGVTEADNAFRMGELEQSLATAREMIAAASPSWRALESHRLLERLSRENEERLAIARERLRRLDFWRRQGLELGTTGLGSQANWQDWLKQVGVLRAELARDTPGPADKLLEVVESRAALERVVLLLRTETAWLVRLGQGPSSDAPEVKPLAQLRASWFQATAPSGASRILSSGEIDVANLPAEFREGLAPAALEESGKWLALGAAQLEKSWPGRDPAQGIPAQVESTIKDSPHWTGWREWVISLRRMAAPVDRPLPSAEALDPWERVVRFVQGYPQTGKIAKIQIDAPLAAKAALQGAVQIEVKVGDQTHSWKAVSLDEFLGLGICRIGFEAPDPIPWKAAQTLGARLTADQAIVSWQTPPQPTWAGWSPLGLPGKVDSQHPQCQGVWKCKIIPPLPEVPELLGP